MALREGAWRGHRQWICDEHRFDTLLEQAARDHVAEFHADEAVNAAAVAELAADPAPSDKKGK